MTGPTPTRDPGLQPERTRLAWRRTVLAGTVATMLALRMIVQWHPLALVLATVLVTAGWLTMLAVSWRRISTLTAAVPPPASRVIPVAALVTAGFAGLSLALVTTP